MYPHFPLATQENDAPEDDIVFSDYDAALAGVGDPMTPVRPVTSTTTLPPTTSSSTMTTTTTPETMMPSTSSTAGSVSDIDPRIVNRPQDADSINPDDDFVFPEETTEPPTDAGDPSLGGVDPSLRRSPLPLSPCLPLDQLDCGLLASPGLTQGLLEFVESGNVRTDQVRRA